MEKINKLEKEILELRERLARAEAELNEHTTKINPLNELSNNDIARYSRQIILPEFGPSGQIKLKKSSVLIVGAGGLGCPAALYLVSAGIGNIGIVDYDIVEKNNLHRQVLYSQQDVNLPKAKAAKQALIRINPYANITNYNFQINSENGLEIIREYDIILDCTDNVPTRYLLNDACVLTGRPLVSGSALKFEGQLTIYNYKDGPCYRCIFPTPPPPETVTNCGDGGVFGAVTGVIGSLQALETIKIILNLPDVLNARLLLFDGFKSVFRNVRLRTKRDNCNICSNEPLITRLIDYEQFCEMRATDKDFSLSLLEEHERISVAEYKEIVDEDIPHLLIDVRNSVEFEMCNLKGSINIPLKNILEDRGLDRIVQMVEENNIPVYFLCRRGNDSQLAVKHSQDRLKYLTDVKDIFGGLYAWHREIDESFPIY